MGPIKPIGPSDRPLQAHEPPEANEPPKLHGPRGHCPPCPLLGGPGHTPKSEPQIKDKKGRAKKQFAIEVKTQNTFKKR